MAFFLTIFEGSTPADARPVIAIKDPDILAVVRQMLSDRLTEALDDTVLPLKARHGRIPRLSRRPDGDA
jgi:hypothetical protein